MFGRSYQDPRHINLVLKVCEGSGHHKPHARFDSADDSVAVVSRPFERKTEGLGAVEQMLQDGSISRQTADALRRAIMDSPLADPRPNGLEVNHMPWVSVRHARFVISDRETDTFYSKAGAGTVLEQLRGAASNGLAPEECDRLAAEVSASALPEESDVDKLLRDHRAHKAIREREEKEEFRSTIDKIFSSVVDNIFGPRTHSMAN